MSPQTPWFFGTQIRSLHWSQWVRYFFLAIAALYTLCFIWPAFMAPLLAKMGAWDAADSYYQLLSGTCHQQPSKCFWLLGYPMALCARCIGIYSGFLGGLTLLVVWPTFKQLPLQQALKWVVPTLLLFLVEKLLTWYAHFPYMLPVALMNGLGLGFVMAWGYNAFLRIIGLIIGNGFNQLIKLFAKRDQ